MRNQITLITVLALLLITITGAQGIQASSSEENANSKSKVLFGTLESGQAIARLGNLSTSDVRERLNEMRLAAYAPGPVLIERIIKEQGLPLVSGPRVERLKAALRPVLAYHEREQMPIFVVRSEQPKANLVARAAIIITSKLMVIASDEEICGIVAHELGHEYMWQERINAKKANDINLMRECELFCDAVAAFTLKEIGHDPASYGRIIERLTIIGINAGSTVKQESDTHPSLDARKKLNKFLCQRLK